MQYASRIACVWTMPLGCPVVPLEYMMLNGSSLSIGVASGSASAGRSPELADRSGTGRVVESTRIIAIVRDAGPDVAAPHRRC